MHHPSRFRASIVPVLGFVLLGGCFLKKQNSPSEEYVNRITERVSTKGLVEQEVDLDADGTTDILNYYRPRADAPRLLVRKELDLNHDGKYDVITFFDDDGNLSREEMDSDYDGRFDWTDHYKRGVRVMSEYDTDYDGVPNMFKYYIQDDDGAVYLDRKERDEDGDGKIDVWERFSKDGEVIRTGRDTDGDGKVDERLE
ncbi:MAG: hypothetical protein KTR31_28225 [Myxococcales bacterium]|nr:hypothetical protein [Myxococcales bacterium]